MKIPPLLFFLVQVNLAYCLPEITRTLGVGL